jgi:hypothetical protein
MKNLITIILLLASISSYSQERGTINLNGGSKVYFLNNHRSVVDLSSLQPVDTTDTLLYLIGDGIEIGDGIYIGDEVNNASFAPINHKRIELFAIKNEENIIS